MDYLEKKPVYENLMFNSWPCYDYLFAISFCGSVFSVFVSEEWGMAAAEGLCWVEHILFTFALTGNYFCLVMTFFNPIVAYESFQSSCAKHLAIFKGITAKDCCKSGRWPHCGCTLNILISNSAWLLKFSLYICS